jgi:hypothetical protein
MLLEEIIMGWKFLRCKDVVRNVASVKASVSLQPTHWQGCRSWAEAEVIPVTAPETVLVGGRPVYGTR